MYSAAILKVQSIKVRAAIVKYTRGDLIADALAGSQFYTNSKLCVSSTLDVSSAVRICGIPAIDAHQLTLNPLLDGRYILPKDFPSALSDIFNQASIPCTTPQAQIGRSQTAKGRQLTARSAISAENCKATSPSSSDNISVDEYLSSSHPQLAALGYVESIRVIADRDLLLIAGGDIFINRLELRENTSTVIASLTGILLVEEIVGFGKLTLASREGVYTGGQHVQSATTTQFNFEVGNKFIPFQIIKNG